MQIKFGAEQKKKKYILKDTLLYIENLFFAFS